MKRTTHLVLLSLNLFLCTQYIFSQVRVDPNNSVGIGTNTPNSSAKLEITRNQNEPFRGLLLPRMTHNEMLGIQNPAQGLEVFNTTYNKPYWYNGSTWLSFEGGGTTQLLSTDGMPGNVQLSSGGGNININVNDADHNIDNEGKLTVASGGSNASSIISNTSTSLPIKVIGGQGILVSENVGDNSITIQNFGDADKVIGNEVIGVTANGLVVQGGGSTTDPLKIGLPTSGSAGQVLRLDQTANLWLPSDENDAVIGNEVKSVLPNMGLSITGLGTVSDPLKIGLIPGISHNQILKWDHNSTPKKWILGDDNTITSVTSPLALVNPNTLKISAGSTNQFLATTAPNTITWVDSPGKLELVPVSGGNSSVFSSSIKTNSAGSQTIKLASGAGITMSQNDSDKTIYFHNSHNLEFNNTNSTLRIHPDLTPVNLPFPDWREAINEAIIGFNVTPGGETIPLTASIGGGNNGGNNMYEFADNKIKMKKAGVVKISIAAYIQNTGTTKNAFNLYVNKNSSTINKSQTKETINSGSEYGSLAKTFFIEVAQNDEISLNIRVESETSHMVNLYHPVIFVESLR